MRRLLRRAWAPALPGAAASLSVAAALLSGLAGVPEAEGVFRGSPAAEDSGAVRERIAAAIGSVDSDEFAGLERSLWIGTADSGFSGGGPLYAESPEAPRPAASSIKTSYLVELFTDRANTLGEALPGSAAAAFDSAHPAVSPFDARTQAEIREHLETASAETVGFTMIRGTEVSNAVYNAAANLVTAFLGGPAELTRRIHARHPDFSGIHARRYMLAARDVTGDNEATARSLAAVLASIARGDTPGAAPETIAAMRDILFLEETAHGRHFYKGGSLNSSPITRVLSGFFERPEDLPGRQLVYVAMAEIPGPESVAPGDDRAPEDAGRRLQSYLEALLDRALSPAREWLAAEPPTP